MPESLAHGDPVQASVQAQYGLVHAAPSQDADHFQPFERHLLQALGTCRGGRVLKRIHAWRRWRGSRGFVGKR